MAAMNDRRDALDRAAPSRRVWFAFLALVLPLLILLDACAQSGVYWKTNYYDVSGSSIRELHHSMRRNRPERVERDALTEWSVRTQCNVTPFQGAYRCAGFSTIVAIRITLPRWTPEAGVAESVKEAWQSYIAALTEHELGHAQFALSMASELHGRVRDMGADSDAEALRSRVQTLVEQTTEEFKQREREYDRLTNHGMNRGVMLAIADDDAFVDRTSVRSERGERGHRWSH